MYEAVPRLTAADCPETRLRRADVRRLIETGVLVPIAREDVRGHFKLFAVPEPFKNRRRPIKWPFVINDALGKDTIDPDMRIAGKKQILALVLKGDYFAEYDGASFFDQFRIDPEIGALMCCRKGNKFYRVGTGPMGLRQMVQVAQRTMQVISTIPDAQAGCEVCIDNGIIFGTFGGVKHDLIKILHRAKAVNCTFKEEAALTNDMDSCIKQRGEWGGVAFDLATKQVWLTDKVHQKIIVSWSFRDCWSFRGFAAHIGLLFWSIGILEIPMSSFFALLRFISHVGLEMTENPDRWDDKIEVWHSAMTDIAAWTDICLSNAPRVLRPPPEHVDWIVCSDACRFGWGYVALNVATGQVQSHGERWSYPFFRAHHPTDELRRSTFTEPHGVYNSACHLLRKSDMHQRIIFGTDNVSTRAGFDRGYSGGSFNINNCADLLRRTFSTSSFSFEFRSIAGSKNVHADALSRGTSTSATTGEIAQDLRSWAGVATN